MELIEAVKKTFSLREKQYIAKKVTNVTATYSKQNKLLYFKARVISASSNSVSYNIIVAFKSVDYSPVKTRTHTLKYTLNTGELLYLAKPNLHSHLMSRCSCPDYRFMWMYYNKQPKALVGPVIPYTKVPGSNRPPRNPTETPGLCKHTLTLVRKLISLNILQRDPELLSYLDRLKKEIE